MRSAHKARRCKPPRELGAIAETLGSEDFRVSSGGNWYLVVDAPLLGCKASVQFRHKTPGKGFLLFWPFPDGKGHIARQERRFVETADQVVAVVGLSAPEDQKDPVLWHGTSPEKLEDILRHGVTAPSYWGPRHVAEDYAEGVLVGIPASRFPEGALTANGQVIHLQCEDDPELADEWTRCPQDWRSSLRLFDSVRCGETVRVGPTDVVNMPTDNMRP